MKILFFFVTFSIILTTYFMSINSSLLRTSEELIKLRVLNDSEISQSIANDILIKTVSKIDTFDISLEDNLDNILEFSNNLDKDEFGFFALCDNLANPLVDISLDEQNKVSIFVKIISNNKLLTKVEIYKNNIKSLIIYKTLTVASKGLYILPISPLFAINSLDVNNLEVRSESLLNTDKFSSSFYAPNLVNVKGLEFVDSEYSSLITNGSVVSSISDVLIGNTLDISEDITGINSVFSSTSLSSSFFPEVNLFQNIDTLFNFSDMELLDFDLWENSLDFKLNTFSDLNITSRVYTINGSYRDIIVSVDGDTDIVINILSGSKIRNLSFKNRANEVILGIEKDVRIKEISLDNSTIKFNNFSKNSYIQKVDIYNNSNMSSSIDFLSDHSSPFIKIGILNMEDSEVIGNIISDKNVYINNSSFSGVVISNDITVKDSIVKSIIDQESIFTMGIRSWDSFLNRINTNYNGVFLDSIEKIMEKRIIEEKFRRCIPFDKECNTFL